MSPQEIMYQGETVMVVSMVSRSGLVHLFVRNFMGRIGKVVGDSKNGMLLIQFGQDVNCRAIPAGCVVFMKDLRIVGH